MYDKEKLEAVKAEIEKHNLAEDGLTVVCQKQKRNNFAQKYLHSKTATGFLSYAHGNLYFIPLKGDDPYYEKKEIISYEKIFNPEDITEFILGGKRELEIIYKNGKADLFVINSYMHKEILIRLMKRFMNM